MSWAKLDDKFHAHPKVLRAMHAEPAAVALHVLALSYSADYELDGGVPQHYVASVAGANAEHLAAVLVDAGLWRANGDGWEIHDFLDFNPSRAELQKRRQVRARAGRKGGRASGQTRRDRRSE